MLYSKQSNRLFAYASSHFSIVRADSNWGAVWIVYLNSFLSIPENLAFTFKLFYQKQDLGSVSDASWRTDPAGLTKGGTCMANANGNNEIPDNGVLFSSKKKMTIKHKKTGRKLEWILLWKKNPICKSYLLYDSKYMREKTKWWRL